MSGYLKHFARRLGIGGDDNLLVLLTHLAAGVEGDGNVTFAARRDASFGIVGNGAATAGMTARDDEVAIAFIGEMKAIGDTLSLGDATEIMEVGIKDNGGKPHRLIVASS